jgi:flagellar motor switch/type III secretory pathway protein FliN
VVKRTEANVSEHTGTQFAPTSAAAWLLDEDVAELDFNQVRLSRGFLRADIQTCFPGLHSYWLPLFLGFGLKTAYRGCSINLEFPKDLDRTSAVEIDGELALIGIEAKSIARFAESIIPGSTMGSPEALIEYLERRLVATLAKSWSGVKAINCSYAPDAAIADADIVGSIKLALTLNGSPVDVWFGVGPQLAETIDQQWREKIVNQSSADRNGDRNAVVRLSVVLAEVALPPTALIESMRAGARLELPTEISDDVVVKLGGATWAEGKLRTFNGRFAVELTGFSPAAVQHTESKTKVVVELADVELTKEALTEYHQPGAVLLTKAVANPRAALRISGEKVAEAEIEAVDGQFRLLILST